MRFPMMWLTAALLFACGDEGVGDGQDEESFVAEEKIRNGEVTEERPEVGRINGCTATLVAPDVAITAAHCVGYGTRTSPGRYNTLRLSNGGETRRFTVNRYRSFSRTLGANDICLLGLAEMVPADFATPAPIAKETPEAGTSLTVYGYGCTQIGGRGGDGRKRKATYAEGDRAQHLCPGDSGGPVFNDETGAVARINSGYRRDRGNTDIYGLVPGSYDALAAQIRDWTAGEIPEEGGGLDPRVPVCGRNFEVFENWTCTGARDARYRCLPGGVPTWESCDDGCASRAVGKDDTCASIDAPDTCGDVYRPFSRWVCATDDMTLVRCTDGALEIHRCGAGCDPVSGAPDGCLE